MSDYARIASAIEYISDHGNEQPALEDIARHVRLSPFHFQRMFTRWAGITPKRFLQVLTLERAKALLADSDLPMLAASDAVGLSSPSRLHDHFVQLDAMTPGEYKNGGSRLDIIYGTAMSPFGAILVGQTTRGICHLSFINGEGVDAIKSRIEQQWPEAELVRDDARVIESTRAVFDLDLRREQPLSLLVRGTNFQINVWRALLEIPPDSLASYGEIAAKTGKPRAVRAAGTAVGANPIAFVIPCHRVIRASGELGGYRWGLTRKHAIHAWEAARWG